MAKAIVGRYYFITVLKNGAIQEPGTSKY